MKINNYYYLIAQQIMLFFFNHGSLFCFSVNFLHHIISFSSVRVISHFIRILYFEVICSSVLYITNSCGLYLSFISLFLLFLFPCFVNSRSLHIEVDLTWTISF